MRFKRLLIIFLSFIFPIYSVFAYSNEVVLGGDNIGIELKTKGVLVVGLYKVNNELIASSSGITTGDYIISVNNKEVNTIDEFSNEINNDDDKKKIDVKYKRNNKEYKTNLMIELEDNEYKTGLYVKDKVNGIGTLTLIDPENNRFLALGHEIKDNVSNKLLDINDGSIYSSYITGIIKSTDGSIGEKESTTNLDDRNGTILNNTNKGIFGIYEANYNRNNLIKVADNSEVVLGEASILTAINGNEKREFKINIDKIDYKDNLKNILFSVTDKELLDITGGIVQGMSGSPIIQNGKIVGAVTHVIVDDCTKGYGIFIKNMLEESEKE